MLLGAIVSSSQPSWPASLSSSMSSDLGLILLRSILLYSHWVMGEISRSGKCVNMAGSGLLGTTYCAASASVPSGFDKVAVPRLQHLRRGRPGGGWGKEGGGGGGKAGVWVSGGARPNARGGRGGWWGATPAREGGG